MTCKNSDDDSGSEMEAEEQWSQEQWKGLVQGESKITQENDKLCGLDYG